MPAPPSPPPAPEVSPSAAPEAKRAPDVLGLDRRRAEDRLREAGFEVHVSFEETEDPQSAVPPEGMVLHQSPRAGEPVPGGILEILILRRADSVPARPPDRRDGGVAVPDLAGRTVGDAIALALRAGLLPVLEPAEDAGAASGRVAAHAPAAGEGARPGSPLVLRIGLAPIEGEAVALPPLVGLARDEAARRLAALGLRAELRRVQAGGAPPTAGARVVAQWPTSFAAKGATVALWLAGS
jgi:hypothetical protein